MGTKSLLLKRFMFQIALPLLSVWSLDQGSKAYVAYTRPDLILLNTGMIAGTYAHAPEIVKSLILFSVFFILVSIFVLLQFLFFKSARGLSLLISFLVGAFGSNLIDKFRLGGAVDFIYVPLPGSHTMVFNGADFIQQFVVVALLIYLWKNSKTIWPLINFRKTWIVDYSFQITSALFTSIFCLLGGIAVSLLSYLILVSTTLKPDFEVYFVSVGLLLVSFTIIVFSASIVFFNRAAGPVFAATRFIDQLNEGKFGTFKMRKTDYFLSLEKSLNRLSTKLKERD